MTSQTYRDYYHFLNTELSHRIIELALELLGEPTFKKAYEWRYGRKGSLSISVRGDHQGRFYDFETSTHGSALDLITREKGLKGQDLCQWARDWLGVSQELTWNPVFPVPSSASTPDFQKAPLSYLVEGKSVEASYPYYTLEGKLLGYVVRLVDNTGNKITPTVTYCVSNTGRYSWRWKGFGEARTPFGLEKLTNPTKKILIVEGEKTAVTAQKLFPQLIVLTWVGGAKNVLKADWSYLKGREVIIWPDNDLVGHEAAVTLKGHLQEIGALSADIVSLPETTPPKWDLGDPLPLTWISEYLKVFLPSEKALPCQDTAPTDITINLPSTRESHS